MTNIYLSAFSSFSELMDSLREPTNISFILRMLCAMILGAAVGLERETKRRAAGFRTHTLICIGASITTMTSQFLTANGFFTDPARLGAQVIAGMSFIGAGVIIVTGRRQVKGLTTAAGLWVTAIVGLAVGAGYFEAAILAVVFILFSEIVLSKLEYYVISRARAINVFVEFDDMKTFDSIVEHIKASDADVRKVEVTKSYTDQDGVAHPSSAIISVKFKRRTAHEGFLSSLGTVPGVDTVEEL